MYQNARSIFFTPKVNIGGDVLSIRTVICVGYTNVAGMRERGVVEVPKTRVSGKVSDSSKESRQAVRKDSRDVEGGEEE